ncbi:SHOCT domain-containing protein [Mucilaginibacter sp. HMF5004]|uniref:SHOCT domain-containing protein n=1 Tax=Mucilaginibacter rivuli TaxID=2857527 RepID=UPI001C5EB6EE|nr:SHOCT domain-containing protein [Mucilaginibacter rivuli]MBW4889213.1 SHOCT domain-containing protein [Mucilaginibacter rivuli]
MKHILLTGILCLVAIGVMAQKKTEYKASNGITYHVGDTVKLGRGSSTSGNFMYVQMGGWAKSLTYQSGKGAEQYDLDRNFAGRGAIIKKIRSEKSNGAERIVFTVGMGNISNYDMYIEDAIGTCEIADCKKNIPNSTAAAVAPSAADELAKYKKLLDAGAITKAEYEAKKKKLLDL